ncbi:MAG TPA: sialate O-acetylesterase [Polyangiaceae bacterium]|jgi:sialate O-acetylesterase|nr:sialate O-acetylesterase [Polyangiaceae bacterium]
MQNERAGLRLAALFSDHMVLQRERPTKLWGWDEPGQRLTARLRAAGARSSGVPRAAGGELCAVSTLADDQGRFLLRLPALPAGGPYELFVEGSRGLTLHDVWIGEVWLASGQSNMEWKLGSALDAEREVEQADWPQIRLFKVDACAAREPQPDVSGQWLVAAPENAADFSAVGYFFARELHQARGVAVGIIDSTWGGTCIEAWASLEALAPVLPELPAQLAELAEQLRELPRLQREYERAFAGWQREHLPGDESNQGLARGWARPDFDDRAWPQMPLPNYWQTRGLSFNGVVWFRCHVDIPESFAAKDLILSLGALDDFDDTYFEGEAVGKTPPGTLDAHQRRRRYELPASSVKHGRRCVAVRVFDHYGNGGFAGPSSELYVARADGLGERIPLTGAWRYQVEREIPLVPNTVFQTAPAAPLALALHNAPASLFNGMIAPLLPCALRGAIWYQGESNVARSAQYRALMVALIRDWRTRFGQGPFPFYLVQLANFRAAGDWPLLREAQSQALSEPETGMAIAIDVGDPTDIHPRNKQEVGRRLALLARAHCYGERELEAHGPRVVGFDLQGAQARVRWAHARGLSTRDGAAVRGFELAGRDGVFQPATARIVAEEVWVESPAISEPCALRYGWADDPDVNLQNAAGLPAEPFRSDGFRL